MITLSKKNAFFCKKTNIFFVPKALRHKYLALFFNLGFVFSRIYSFISNLLIYPIKNVVFWSILRFSGLCADIAVALFCLVYLSRQVHSGLPAGRPGLPYRK